MIDRERTIIESFLKFLRSTVYIQYFHVNVFAAHYNAWVRWRKKSCKYSFRSAIDLGAVVKEVSKRDTNGWVFSVILCCSSHNLVMCMFYCNMCVAAAAAVDSMQEQLNILYFFSSSLLRHRGGKFHCVLGSLKNVLRFDHKSLIQTKNHFHFTVVWFIRRFTCE